MRFLLAFGLLLTVATAQAEIVFAPGISYFKQSDEDNGADAGEMVFSTYDFKLGYVGTSGLYLGGMYQMRGGEIGGVDIKGTAVGPTLGFNHYSGFYALFTYFLMAEEEIGTAAKYTDGMGPQIDLGWVFPITRVFMIGPQISYRSIGYDKLEAGGAEVDADFTRSNILPYVSLWFRF